MNTIHSQIKVDVAEAIRANDDVRSFCVDNFGRGALVIVDWFSAQGAPGVKESPYILIYSTGDSETGETDEETFDFTVEIGAVASPSMPRKYTSVERTDTENGIVINGCAEKLETLRSFIIGIIKSGSFGASLRSISLDESSTIGYPLEWSSMRVTFYEPQTISL